MYLFVLGRQPEIGLAELRSVYGDTVRRDGEIAIAKVSGQPDLSRLGSVVKVAQVIGDDWAKARTFLPEEVKVTIGFSAYNTNLRPKDLNELGMDIKTKRGSVRMIRSEKLELSSATVYHNKLARGDKRFEFIFANVKGRPVLARTVYVQDIDAYAFRDRARPRRDARVGMLPPKLAQTMINLAIGSDIASTPPAVVLDPFCGTGVVLQEAALMGQSVYGTDIEPRMVDYTTDNLKWLRRSHRDVKFFDKLEIGDATTHRWQPVPRFVVSEIYLGTPYAQVPPPEKLHDNIKTCSLILEKFLTNIAGQLPRGTRLCLAVPAWRIGYDNHHLPIVRRLSELGFERSFSGLVYRRPDQIVGRELLVLRRK